MTIVLIISKQFSQEFVAELSNREQQSVAQAQRKANSGSFTPTETTNIKRKETNNSSSMIISYIVLTICRHKGNSDLSLKTDIS